MLDIYQREGEKTRPEFFYSAEMKRGRDVNLVSVEDGETLEAVEIEIGDAEESTTFYTLVSCPPVFISLRPGEPGEDPETCLSVPDDEPDVYAEQMAAAQLESGLAALEAAAPEYRDLLQLQFGLTELGQEGAGPRSLRPAARMLSGTVSVKFRFADGTREEYTLSPECPALCLDTEQHTIGLALSPAVWAASVFFAVAETWKGCSKKTRKRLCTEYGIDMQTFIKREEQNKNNI